MSFDHAQTARSYFRQLVMQTGPAQAALAPAQHRQRAEQGASGKTAACNGTQQSPVTGNGRAPPNRPADRQAEMAQHPMARDAGSGKRALPSHASGCVLLRM